MQAAASHNKQPLTGSLLALLVDRGHAPQGHIAAGRDGPPDPDSVSVPDKLESDGEGNEAAVDGDRHDLSKEEMAEGREGRGIRLLVDEIETNIERLLRLLSIGGGTKEGCGPGGAMIPTCMDGWSPLLVSTSPILTYPLGTCKRERERERKGKVGRGGGDKRPPPSVHSLPLTNCPPTQEPTFPPPPTR